MITYWGLYAAARFVIEFFRGDPRGDVLGLTSLTGLSTSQLISLLVGATSICVLAVRWRRAGGAAPRADDASVSGTAASA